MISADHVWIPVCGSQMSVTQRQGCTNDGLLRVLFPSSFWNKQSLTKSANLLHVHCLIDLWKILSRIKVTVVTVVTVEVKIDFFCIKHRDAKYPLVTKMLVPCKIKDVYLYFLNNCFFSSDWQRHRKYETIRLLQNKGGKTLLGNVLGNVRSGPCKQGKTNDSCFVLHSQNWVPLCRVYVSAPWNASLGSLHAV